MLPKKAERTVGSVEKKAVMPVCSTLPVVCSTKPGDGQECEDIAGIRDAAASKKRVNGKVFRPGLLLRLFLCWHYCFLCTVHTLGRHEI